MADPENVTLDNKDAPPPEYGAADAGGGGQANTAPPAYDSLYGKLKQANVESSSPVEYAKKSVSVLEGACGCCIAVVGILLCCGLGLALPIAEIVVGAIYLHDCPINHLIPIYLIVGGVFSFLAGGGNCAGSGSGWKKRLTRSDEPEEEKDTKQKAGNCCGSLISIFLLVWLCCGTVWTVRARDYYTPEKFVNGTSGVINPTYCHETVFQFAFWLSMASWIIAGTIVCFACLFCCCLCCVKCFSKD